MDCCSPWKKSNRFVKSNGLHNGQSEVTLLAGINNFSESTHDIMSNDQKLRGLKNNNLMKHINYIFSMQFLFQILATVATVITTYINSLSCLMSRYRSLYIT